MTTVLVSAFFGRDFSIYNKMSDEIQFKSLEECIEKYIPHGELKEVKRILYGRSEE